MVKNQYSPTFFKQGTNFIMPVRFNIALSDVESIDFIMRQDDAVWEFSYPSEVAALRADSEENIVDVIWTEEKTWLFDRYQRIYMDTKIHLKDSWQNPQTNIVEFRLSKTLFEQGGDSTGNGGGAND